MCGILFTTDPTVAPEDFAAALDLMRHRGPDAPGRTAAFPGGVRLGHNRLSVVDLEARSHQPFLSAGGRYAIVFNGEIYNHRELARQHGLTLRTTSDTEVLVELFARHGKKMLGWLNGMFAFVIFDTRTGEYFVARDRLGVKPLYVHENGRGLTVASELNALLHLFPAATPDEFAIRQYRKLRGFFNGRTLYREVQMFPAAHYRVGAHTVRYWDLPEGEQPPPSDEELEFLVGQAVECRGVADVPVGSYLSGGLDSSIVAALSNRTHTWVVGLAAENEFSWAALVAQRLGTTHHAITVEPERFIAAAREMIRRRREPLAVPNEVLLYEMTRAVKKENTVVLSGEGADELFAGYDRIFRWAATARTWDFERFTALYCYGSRGDAEVVEDALAPFVGRGTPYAIVSAFFQVAHLHGLLRRLDSSTMLCSVEAREPFVDFRLVERLAGVGLDYKLAGGNVKAPLKRVFGRWLPPEVVQRPKVGFPVPLDRLLPPGPPGATAIDRWFDFNLGELGLEEAALNPFCA